MNDNFAIKDELTGVYSYEYFQSRIVEEINRSNRYNKPFSIVRSDIDHFKDINEKYGTECGNLVLKQLADIYHNSTRATDLIARGQAEEFVIILPEVDLEDGVTFAERMRKKVEDYQEFGLANNPVSITISSGVVTYNRKESMEVAQILQLLDSTVFQAKEDGRNTIVPYTSVLQNDSFI